MMIFLKLLAFYANFILHQKYKPAIAGLYKKTLSDVTCG